MHKHKIISSLIASITIALTVSRPVFSAILSYKSGTKPFSSEIHAVIYADKIGSTPLKNGIIEINGKSISIHGSAPGQSGQTAQSQFGEYTELLSGELVKPHFYEDSIGAHIKGIAFFTGGQLAYMGNDRDIVFVERGFASGRITTIDDSQIVISDRGLLHSIPLTTVHDIRSRRAYTVQFDLTSINNADSPNGTQYEIAGYSWHETVPPSTIPLQSIAHHPSWGDDWEDSGFGSEFDGLQDDPSLNSSLVTPAANPASFWPSFPWPNRP